MRPGTEIILRIEGIAPTGKGAGRFRAPDGGETAVFVEGTAPGDEARVLVRRARKKYAEARLVALLARSPERADPPCPHAGPCGGCALMHLTPDAQRAAKEDFVRFAVRGAVPKDAEIAPLVAAPAPLHYRSRLTFRGRLAPSDGLVLGFFSRGSHEFVPAPSCMLGVPALDAVRRDFEVSMRRVRDASAEMDVTFACDEETGRVAVAVDGTTNLPSALQKRLRDFMKEHASRLAGVTALVRGEKLWSEPARVRVGYRLDVPRPLALMHPAHGFAQVSWEANRLLVREVLAAASLTGTERVLDLYSGCGNFSLPLALRSREVVGIESDAESVEAARENAEANEIPNIRFERRLAEDALRRFSRENERFDVCVLDPPRRGMGEPLKALARLDVRCVVYVSCSLRSLRRDLAILDRVGYRARRVVPLDMFPQTHHVECVVTLER